METGHAYLPLHVDGWGGNDPGSPRKLGSGSICFRVVIIEVGCGGIVAIFPQQWWWLCTHQTYLFWGVTLGLKPYILTTQVGRVQGTAKQPIAPRWNPWLGLCLPSDSILENCLLNLPCCRSSTCHIPLKFLEILLGLFIGCQMVISRITFLEYFLAPWKQSMQDKKRKDRGQTLRNAFPHKFSLKAQNNNHLWKRNWKYTKLQCTV